MLNKEQILKCAQYTQEDVNCMFVVSFYFVIIVKAKFSESLDSDILPRITDNHMNATARRSFTKLKQARVKL